MPDVSSDEITMRWLNLLNERAALTGMELDLYVDDISDIQNYFADIANSCMKEFAKLEILKSRVATMEQEANPVGQFSKDFPNEV